MRPREERIRTLQVNPEVSVLIIGAGINGIGTFRDLALQGIDVLLIDRGDYCSGASAASSHMVHGGIRYLENGEFQLVKEAVQERNRLIENTPHLVKPLKTTYPIFKWFSGLLNAPLKFIGLLEKPSERGAIVIKIGMLFYDFLTRKQKTVPKHIFLNRNKSLTLFPALNKKILFTGTYYDGVMQSPERIGIELLQDAIEENNKAISLNYMSFLSADGNTVKLKDEINGEVLQVKPKIIVNAAGPWIDLINGEMGKQTHFISGTKGSHLIVDHPELREAIGDNEIFFENKDGRIVLILPFKDKVMIGSSDIRIEDPDDAVITESEVTYFFDMLKRVFPTIQIDRSHIVYTFSGVRPLQHAENGATGQISRNHKVQVIEPTNNFNIPLISLVGGKWTSFRAFSEDATDQILERLGKIRTVSTDDLQIGGSKNYPNNKSELEAYFHNLESIFNIDIDKLEKIFENHGTKTEAILHQFGKEASISLISAPQLTLGEIKYILKNEDVNHLDDLLLRRTMLGKLGLITPESLEEISLLCANALNWSKDKMNLEKDLFLKILKEKHRIANKKFV